MKDFWDERYSADGFTYGVMPNDLLRTRAGDLPHPGPIVSLGEGEGRNAVFLASLGFHVTGVDGSAVGLDKAQRLAASTGVTIRTVCADLGVFDLGEATWGGVISIWCHLPTALRRDLHGRIARAIRPGGVFLLEHYHPMQVPYKTGGPTDTTMLLTVDELRQAFPGWTELHAFEGEREVHEGPLHDGLSYVTQWVGRR